MIWIRSGSARHELFRNPPEFSAFRLLSKARSGGPFFMYPECREDFGSELGEILPRRSYTPIEKKGLSGAIWKNYGRRDTLIACKLRIVAPKSDLDFPTWGQLSFLAFDSLGVSHFCRRGTLGGPMLAPKSH